MINKINSAPDISEILLITFYLTSGIATAVVIDKISFYVPSSHFCYLLG